MHLIVNPAAAGGRLGREWPQMSQRLRELGLDAPHSMTKAPGHAAELAAQALAGGEDVVVAVGGDGTICEVLQGLRGAGRGTLGIIPVGTGNDAARTVGVPIQLDEAVRVLRAGQRRRFDLMLAGHRVVLNAIGIGLLGTINVNSTKIKWVRGIGAYLVAALGTLFKWHCPTIELVGDRSRYTGPMTILAIHNGVTTGGGFRLCPRAIPDDGELDATLVTGTNVPARIGAVGDAIRGTLARKSFTQEIRFKTLDLVIEERLAYHWDGNPAYMEPPGMHFEVLPAALDVITTPKA